MKIKRILSGVLIILGIGLYIFGSYISGEVSMGREKIESAQKNVNQGRKFSQINPFSKEIGGMFADSAQKKIDEGKQEVDKYYILANWLHGGGIVIFVAGIGLLAFSFVRKKSR